jgi:hypothetical protein
MLVNTFARVKPPTPAPAINTFKGLAALISSDTSAVPVISPVGGAVATLSANDEGELVLVTAKALCVKE